MSTVPGNYRGAFTVVAHEDSEVEVYDMATGQILITPEGMECRYSLKAGESIYQGDVVVDQGGPLGAIGAPGRNVRYIKVVSTGRIQLNVGDLGSKSGGGVAVAEPSGRESQMVDDIFMRTPIWNGQEYELYIKGPSTGMAMIFAPADIEVRVNGQRVNLKADERCVVPTGLNRIVSAKPFVAFSYWGQAITSSYGTYLLSTTGIPANEPEIGGGGVMDGWTLYAVVVAVIAVGAVVALFIIRRK